MPARTFKNRVFDARPDRIDLFKFAFKLSLMVV